MTNDNVKSTAREGVKWTFLSSLFTGIGYVIMLLILVRILPKEVFGMFAVANIAAGLGNLGVDLGFSQAIVQKREISSTQLSSLYWINLLLSVAIFCLAFPLGIVMERFYELEGLNIIVIFTMMSLIPNALGLQFYSLLQKNLCFKEIAISEIMGNFFLIALTLFFAFNDYKVWSLVFGLLAGKTVQAGFYIFFGQKIHRPQFVFYRQDMSDFWSFGLFQTGRTLLVYLSNKTDALLIGKLVGVSTLGIYEVIKDLLIRPIALINPVIARVAFPILAQQQTNASLFSAIFQKTLQIFNSLTAVLFVGGFFYANFLTDFVLGENWAGYDHYIRLLSISLFLHFSVSPMGDLITAGGKPQIGFYWNIFNLFATIIFLSIGSLQGLEGILYSLIILSFLKIILSWTFIIHRLSGLPFKSTMIAIFQPLFIALGAGILATFLFSFLSSHFILSIFSVCVYLLFYLLFSVKLNSSFYQELNVLLRTFKK